MGTFHHLRPPWTTCCFALLVSVGWLSATSTGQDQANPDRTIASLLESLSPEQQQRLAEVELTREDELQFGGRLRDAHLKRLGIKPAQLLQRGELRGYVRDVLEPLQPLLTNAARYPKLQVTLVTCDRPFVLVTPGAQLYISTTMVRFTKTEAALFAAIAHEFSHLDRGHQLDYWKAVHLKDGNLKSGKLETSDIETLISLPFSAQQELEADQDAVRWMRSIGYPAEEYAAYLERIADRHQIVQQWSGHTTTESLHPGWSERAAHVRKYAAELASPGKPSSESP